MHDFCVSFSVEYFSKSKPIPTHFTFDPPLFMIISRANRHAHSVGASTHDLARTKRKNVRKSTRSHLEFSNSAPRPALVRRSDWPNEGRTARPRLRTSAHTAIPNVRAQTRPQFPYYIFSTGQKSGAQFFHIECGCVCVYVCYTHAILLSSFIY